MKKQEFLSTMQVAKFLGVSRVTVFNGIKNGKIPAVRIGRNYAIRRADLSRILGAVIGAKDKRQIERAVHRVAREYGETLRLLGQD